MLNQTIGIGGNIEGLRLIAGASRSDELRDQIVHVPTP
jgi:hypothetical protein